MNRISAVDFDGTWVTHEDPPRRRTDVPPAARLLKRLSEAGVKITLRTMLFRRSSRRSRRRMVRDARASPSGHTTLIPNNQAERTARNAAPQVTLMMRPPAVR